MKPCFAYTGVFFLHSFFIKSSRQWSTYPRLPLKYKYCHWPSQKCPASRCPYRDLLHTYHYVSVRLANTISITGNILIMLITCPIFVWTCIIFNHQFSIIGHDFYLRPQILQYFWHCLLFHPTLKNLHFSPAQHSTIHSYSCFPIDPNSYLLTFASHWHWLSFLAHTSHRKVL